MSKIMNPNLQSAIFEFLGNEFHLDPHKVSPDLNFHTDLHLNADDLSNLLTHIQDALNFNIPEEKIENISTIADLFTILAQAEEEGQAYDPAD